MTLGNEKSEEINQAVRCLAVSIEEEKVNGILESIIGYNNVLIHYDPLIITYDHLLQVVNERMNELGEQPASHNKVVEIPVLYGGKGGPDLADVAAWNQLTEDEVIQIHTERTYLVYFLGFSPGFPFLGGLSERIVTPRLENPRTRITAGSVGIANDQTGIYPVDSPGGWRLIGHTPVSLYNPTEAWPFLLAPGDTIKFTAITQAAYQEMMNR